MWCAQRTSLDPSRDRAWAIASHRQRAHQRCILGFAVKQCPAQVCGASAVNGGGSLTCRCWVGCRAAVRILQELAPRCRMIIYTGDTASCEELQRRARDHFGIRLLRYATPAF
jgi:hypothetical protein